MNEVSYSNYRFDDNTIVSGSLTLANALAFDTLAPDEMTVEVLSDDTGIKKLLTNTLDWYHTVDNRGYVLYGGDIRKFTYGDPVYYYYDSTQMGKFYLTSVTRMNDKVFRLNMVSAVGLMTGVQHMGGVYSGETAGTVIAEILSGSGITYTIDTDVRGTKIYGYLPIASARDNLQQVLFAIGASLMKDDAGDIKFSFLKEIGRAHV